MSQATLCPECGAELPTGSLQGLCPKCLLAAGLESRDDEGRSAGSGSEAPTTPHSGSFVPPEPAALAAVFPQLEIIELVGHGGMGAVYKARQKHLDRLVALKIIRPESTDDPAFAERFNREARMLARLSNPSIVAVYDFGAVNPPNAAAGSEPRPLYFFLMEYVDGTNLRQLMQTGELTPKQALAIIPQICEALQFAHDEGIVHRDIKPENILLDKRGRVKIADFGLAKLIPRSSEEFTLTGTHQVMGTPRYMAPEQMEGSHAVDHRADIYSLGVVFYEMLTGEVPAGHFEAPSKKVEIDVRLDEVVLRALAREPERRYQHASDVKTDIESISRSVCAGMTAQRGGRDWVTLFREQIDNDRLPDCCIVCGQHTLERVSKDFWYQPDWAGLLSLVGCLFFLIPGVIIASLTTQRIRVACPICPTHREAWRRLVWVASVGWLAVPMLGLIGFGVAYPFIDLNSPAVLVVPVLGVVIGLVAYLVPVIRLWRQSVGIEWMTSNYVRFCRVSAAFAREAAQMSGAAQTDSGIASRPARSPSTIGTAWYDWWSERDRWFTFSVQVSLALLFVLWLFMYCGGAGSSRLLSQPDGQQRRQTIAEIGSPIHWFRCESWPDDKTPFRWEFKWYLSLGYWALGYLLSAVNWQIEMAKAKAVGKKLGRLGSPTSFSWLWAVLTLIAVVWGLHPIYLS